MMMPFWKSNCLLCHNVCDNRQKLCSGCLNDLAFCLPTGTQVCPTCAVFSPNARPCAACERDPPIWEKLWRSAEYRAPLPAILQTWKHHKNSAFSPIFCHLMLENPPAWLPETHIDAVCAMPISVARRCERGFNQSDELAQVVAQHFRLPVLPHDAILRQHRPPQSTLNKRQRIENIKKIFTVHANVSGKNLLLIDDILTTGASLTELARTLKQAGAAHIYVWVAARNY